MSRAARTYGLLIAILLTTTAVGAPATGSPPRRVPQDGRSVLPLSPVPLSASNATRALNDVSLRTGDDAWAVGSRSVDRVTSLTLTKHWDGTRWTRVKSPSPGTLTSFLTDVSATSATDVWAIGSTRDAGDSEDSPLVEHWDGTSWSVASTPATTGQVYGVSGSGPDDVWIVGDRYENPIAEHWNGTSWTETDLAVPPVDPPYVVSLMLPYDVTVLSPHNAWAVGIYDKQNGQGGYYRELLMEHWDGQSWTFVEAPHQTNWSYPFSVSASSPRDVWAVGVTDARGEHPFFAHWDGKAWSTTSQDLEGGSTWLKDVVAISPDDAWAVGFTNGRRVRAIAERWDGTSWTVDQGADPGGHSSSLSGVDALGTANVVAVGGVSNRRTSQALAQRWDGTDWQRQ